MGRWRITTWWGKLIYVLCAYLVAGRIIGWLMQGLHLPEPAVSIIGFATNVATLLIGARIFRGKGEPVAPPRPWWQMTARRKQTSRDPLHHRIRRCCGRVGGLALRPGEASSTHRGSRVSPRRTTAWSH